MKPHAEEYWQRLKNFGESVALEAERVFDSTDKAAVTLCYFLKLQNTANAGMILLKSNMVQDAKVLSRCLFENMILLRAVRDEENFVPRVLKDLIRRKDLAYKNIMTYLASQPGAALKTPENLTGMQRAKKITENIADAILNFKGKRGLEVDVLSKKFKLDNEYSLFYQTRHDEVHSLPAAIKRHYSKAGGFTSYPDIIHIDVVVRSIFWMYMSGISIIIDLCGLKHLEGQLQELESLRQVNENAPE